MMKKGKIRYYYRVRYTVRLENGNLLNKTDEYFFLWRAKLAVWLMWHDSSIAGNVSIQAVAYAR